uniref:Uncharacterized protein n=1 Tax=Desertifilum tharense IPPAS B-1220 TaxID=1781255 RepID=A0ACD5H0X7_9CYAN
MLCVRVSSRLFQPLARTLAIFFFSIFFYWCSFHWFWNFFVGFYSAENRLSSASPSSISAFCLSSPSGNGRS